MPRKQNKKKKQSTRLMKRVPRSLGNQNVYSFARSRFFQTLTFTTPVGPGWVAGVETFNLQQIPDYTEFTNLFDHYRIKKVNVTFYPQAIGVGRDSGGVANIRSTPTFVSCTDDDDATAPTSVDQMMTRQGIRVRQFTKPFTLTVKPKPQVDMSGTSGASVGSNNSWIDMAQPAIPHYGLKYMFLSDPSATHTYYCHLKYTYYFECKKVR